MVVILFMMDCGHGSLTVRVENVGIGVNGVGRYGDGGSVGNGVRDDGGDGDGSSVNNGV